MELVKSTAQKQAEEELLRDARLFATIFKGPNGQKVLEVIKQEFPVDPDIISSPDDSKTRERLGNAQVTHFIEKMVRIGTEGVEDE